MSSAERDYGIELAEHLIERGITLAGFADGDWDDEIAESLSFVHQAFHMCGQHTVDAVETYAIDHLYERLQEPLCRCGQRAMRNYALCADCRTVAEERARGTRRTVHHGRPDDVLGRWLWEPVGNIAVGCNR